MCSELESCHLYLGDSRVGTPFNKHNEKSISGTQTHPWTFPNIEGIMAATYPGGLMSTAAPIYQGPFARSRNQIDSNRLANPAANSTTSSDPSLDAHTVIGVGEPKGTPNPGLEIADDDTDADADSEAESDTSQYFESESEDIEETEDDDGEDHEKFGWNGCGGSGYAVDDDNDATMTNMEPSVFAQASAYAAITNPNKKPRRCKLSRKHYNAQGLPGTQRSMISPVVLASRMDIDMNAPAEEDPDDYYNDSSPDEDTDGYAYSTWFGGIYHPMWLGHATASGKKRRDNGLDEDAGEGRESKAVEDGAVAELGERHIRLPSLARRKRAWKASQGSQSSVGESEWSLTVNNPMPPPSGSSTGAMSPPMSPTPISATKQMHTAPRSTQPRHRQSPARALERRLENLRVRDLGRGTPVSTAPAVAANDLRPRMSSDQREKKRTRYQQTTPFEVASVEATIGDAIAPVLWDVVLEEPMGIRPSGVDEQWDAQEFRMTGVEVNMSSPMSGAVPLGVSERAKGISRVMEGVDDLL